jgi:adenosylcobinamide-GDP ribazoletransferase
MIEGLRLAVSLLTIVPVPGAVEVDRHRAGWAMTFAPLIGLVLGTFTALAVFGVRMWLGNPFDSPLPALIGLAILAVATGGLHLDGLADLADGFGARRDAAGTLEVMRQPSVGAFAVVAILLVVAVQTWSVTLSISRHHGTVTLIVGVLAGRLAVTLACASNTRAARAEGLGALVVRTVPRWRAAVTVVIAAGVALLAGRFDYHGGRFGESGHAVLALLFGLLVAEGVRRLAVRKLGGLNGDVLGALVEIATAAAMLGMVLRVPRWLN